MQDQLPERLRPAHHRGGTLALQPSGHASGSGQYPPPLIFQPSAGEWKVGEPIRRCEALLVRDDDRLSPALDLPRDRSDGENERAQDEERHQRSEQQGSYVRCEPGRQPRCKAEIQRPTRKRDDSRPGERNEESTQGPQREEQDEPNQYRTRAPVELQRHGIVQRQLRVACRKRDTRRQSCRPGQ